MRIRLCSLVITGLVLATPAAYAKDLGELASKRTFLGLGYYVKAEFSGNLGRLNYHIIDLDCRSKKEIIDTTEGKITIKSWTCEAYDQHRPIGAEKIVTQNSHRCLSRGRSQDDGP